MRRQSFSAQVSFSFTIVTLFIAFSAVASQAQTALHIREPQKNFSAAGSFSLTDFESINTTNGNLIFRYPLGQLPQGRSAARGGFYLQYNSKLHDTFIGSVTDITNQTSEQNLLKEADEGGWSLRYRYELFVLNRNNEIDGGYTQAAFNACSSTGSSSTQNELATYSWKVRLRFPDGSEHVFRPSGYADGRGDGYFNIDTYGVVRTYGCSVPPGSSGCSCSYTTTNTVSNGMTYYSTDGSYLRLTIAPNQDWTLYYPDGSKVTNQGALQRISDRNGNYYDIAFNTIYDNTGRSTTLTYDAATGDSLITQTGVGNTPLIWRIKWKTISINKQYSTTAAVGGQQKGNSAIQTWINDYTVVDKIILPTQSGNLSYTFNYNTTSGWAEVSSVVMPAEASETAPQIAYQYTYPGGLLNGLTRCTAVLRSYPSTKTLTWQEQADGGTSPVPPETWSYNIGSTLSYITAPDGGQTTEIHGPTDTPSIDTGLVKSIERPDGSKTERIWTMNQQPWIGSIPPTMSERNAFVKTEFTSIKNAAGNYSKTAIKDYDYDKNGNLLRVSEYDWINYGDVVRDGSGLPTAIPGSAASALKRVTLNTYNNATPSSTVAGTHANAYWNLSPYPVFVLNATASSEVRPTVSGTPSSRTEYTYDNAATTANVTAKRSWDSAKGALGTLTSSNSVAVINQYGTYFTGTTGKLTKTIDANDVATSYIYGDIGNGTTDLYTSLDKADLT